MCPDIVFEVVNDHGLPIDSDVFHFDGVSSFTISTSDEGKTGTYDLNLEAQYDGPQYTVISTLEFSVDILDLCSSPTIVFPD